MEKLNENKICENCKFFLQHYVKTKLKLRPINCGQCVSNKYRGKLKNKKPSDTACDFWENIDIKDETKEVIKTALKNMAKQINEIAFILKS